MTDFSQVPQARFQVVVQPGALPACCLFCAGTPSEERAFFIDPNVAMEWHGAIYICKLCLFEMASTVGWADPTAVKTMTERITDLEAESYSQAVTIAGYHDLEEALDLLGAGLNSLRQRPGGHLGRVSELDVPSEPERPGVDDEPGAGSTAVGADLVDAGAGTPDEPSDDEGMDFVRSNGGGAPNEFTLGL